jgi:hypothetical protein
MDRIVAASVGVIGELRGDALGEHLAVAVWPLAMDMKRQFGLGPRRLSGPQQMRAAGPPVAPTFKKSICSLGKIRRATHRSGRAAPLRCITPAVSNIGWTGECFFGLLAILLLNPAKSCGTD